MCGREEDAVNDVWCVPQQTMRSRKRVLHMVIQDAQLIGRPAAERTTRDSIRRHAGPQGGLEHVGEVGQWAVVVAACCGCIGEGHGGAQGVVCAVVGDRGHGEQFGAGAAAVVRGDVGPDAACGVLMADAQAQECVAQRGVCGDDYRGAHGQVRCRSGVAGDAVVQVAGGVGDERGDVLGFEVWLGRGIDLLCRRSYSVARVSAVAVVVSVIAGWGVGQYP